MKKVALVAALIALVGIVRADPPYGQTLTTSSAIVLASRTIAPSEATAYTTNGTFTQGQYVTLSNLMWMAVDAGTVTGKYITATSGEQTVDGVTFRNIPTDSANRIIPRNNASIQLVSGDYVWITVGAGAAVTNQGEGLLSAGDQWTPGGDEIIQKEIRAISAGSSVIAIGEQSRD